MRAVDSSRCLNDEQVTALVEGGVSREERDAYNVHLAQCAECRRFVSEMASAAPAKTAKAPAPEELPLRPVAPNDYEVGREIARGGMGRILEAWDRRHLRRVAIKVLLHPEGELAERFVREIRVTSMLQHPAIIPLYEAGLWSSGDPFFAMKLVAGRALSEVVAEATSPEGRLGLLQNVIAVTDALAYAHEQRVIHRDLKPSNVLIGAFGETVVIDWGLAKELDEEPPRSTPAPMHDGVDAELTAVGKLSNALPHATRASAG